MKNVKTILLKNGNILVAMYEENEYGKAVLYYPFEIAITINQEGNPKLFLKGLNPFSADDIFLLEKNDILSINEPNNLLIQLYQTNTILYKVKYKTLINRLLQENLEDLKEVDQPDQEATLLN